MKVAKMVVVAVDRPALFPLVYQVEHTVDGTAHCASSVAAGGVGVREHESPALGECNCGFHAMAPTSPRAGQDIAAEVSALPCAAVLDVELGGRIIQGCDPATGLVKGWRASRQRILAVSVPRRCWYYDAVHPGSAMRCVEPASCVTRWVRPTTSVWLVPVCDAHVDPGWRWALCDLAALWGTEVAWQPDAGGLQ